MCWLCEKYGDTDNRYASCEHCGDLVCFDVKGVGDDLVKPAYMSDSGQLLCKSCGRRFEEAEAERMAVEYGLDPEVVFEEMEI